MSGSHLCIPRNETVQPPYFQNRIIMFCLPVPTLISVRDLYNFQDRSAYFAAAKYVDQSWEFINRSNRHMNVEIRTEATQFLEKEYINWNFVAVQYLSQWDVWADPGGAQAVVAAGGGRHQTLQHPRTCAHQLINLFKPVLASQWTRPWVFIEIFFF